MKNENTREKPDCRPATMRAVPSGRAMARFLGTSSPKTIDSPVAKTSAITAAVRPPRPADSPTSSSSGEISVAMAGSER